VSPPPHLPVCGILPAPHSTNAEALDLSTISSQLTSLAKANRDLSPLPPLPLPTDAPTSEPSSATPAKPPQLLSTLPRDAIIKLIHHEGTNLPSVCPCNTANIPDTKTHLTSEELHQALGCCKFWNYKHLLQVSHDGEWLDGGEFLASLGSYATIRKSTVVVRWTIKNINTLTRLIWILLLAIASPSAVSGMLSSWLIVQHSTTRL
jgi:hypothetical protein